MSKQVVLATGNSGKVAEMQQILQGYGLDIIAQSEFNIPEAIEDGLSFVENAIIKARHACELTGLPAIADDSGLQVDALNGAPGIYSARYASNPSGDQANNDKLLNKLAGKKNRRACFQCVIVYLEHALDPTPTICTGTWQGEIAEQPHGENGFGYDPLFYIPELDLHSAELEPAQKKQISHRGRALIELKTKLKDILTPEL